MIVRRYDQRSTSDRSSAYAALISNISERDRAEDVEQFDDILRNFIDETNKYEGRFGKLRDEEKVLAVKKVDAREFAELSIPWHHIATRRTAHRAGEHHHTQAHDTFGIEGEEKMTRAHQWRSAWPQEPMARQLSKKGTEKHLNLQCKQCITEQEPKVDGTEERVPVGVCRSA